MVKVRTRIMIKGQVQGMYFRAGIKKRAKELTLRGWVRNNPDGSVEALVEGDDVILDRLIEYCKVGPQGAKVETVEIKKEKFENAFTDFVIKY
ncbi:MAG: acylphosphatase [Candidatus Woesearchaeota archaeon]